MKKFLYSLTLFLVLLLKSPGSLLALTIFYDDTRSGETSMAKGISKAFLDESSQKPDLYASSDQEKFRERLSGEKDTLLLIGQQGFDVIDEHAEYLRSKGWKIAHVAHQIFDKHKEIITQVDELFLPGHLEGLDFQKSHLPDIEKAIWINGVPIALSLEDAKSAYEKEKESFSNSDSFYVVYLAGDAEGTDKSTLLYSAEEARSLAEYVAQNSGDSHIIILNGPRTGKHDLGSNVIQDVHRAGPIDHVTEAFVGALKEKNKPHTLFDFRFGEKSMYTPVLGLLVSQKGSQILIPGESNSVITDIVILGLQKQATAFIHQAMNELHHANVKYSNVKQGLAYLDKNFIKHEAKVTDSIENPSVQVAHALIKLSEQ